MVKKLILLLLFCVFSGTSAWLILDSRDSQSDNIPDFLPERQESQRSIHDTKEGEIIINLEQVIKGRKLKEQATEIINKNDTATEVTAHIPVEQNKTDIMKEMEIFVTNALQQGYFNRAEVEKAFFRRDFDELAASLPYQSHEDTEIKQDMERVLADELLESQSQAYLTALECGSSVCMASLTYEDDDEIRVLLNETLVSDSRVKSVISQPVIQDGIKKMRILFSYSEKISAIEL